MYRGGHMPCYFMFDNASDLFLLDEGCCRLLGIEYTGDWVSSELIDKQFTFLDDDTFLKVLFTDTLGNKISSNVRINLGPHEGDCIYMSGSVIQRDNTGIALMVVGYLTQVQSNFIDFVSKVKDHSSAFDIDTHTGKIHYGSGYRALLGYKESDALPKNIIDLAQKFVHPDDLGIFSKQADVIKDPQLGDYYETIYRMKHNGGYYIWCIDRSLVVERNRDGRATRIIGTTTNIDVVRSNFERLKRSIYQDPLTGLHNRLYLNTRYKYFTMEESQPLSVVYVDISGLKVINDYLGHTQGDLLVKLAADVLQNDIYLDHELVRLSGDEFLLLFTNCPSEYCKAFINKFSLELNARNLNQEFALPLFFGFGVATLYETGKNDTFLQCEARADARLQEYKRVNHERIYSALRSFLEYSLGQKIDFTDNRSLDYLNHSDKVRQAVAAKEQAKNQKQEEVAEGISLDVQDVDKHAGGVADDVRDLIKTQPLLQPLLNLETQVTPDENVMAAAIEVAREEDEYATGSLFIPDDLGASTDIRNQDVSAIEFFSLISAYDGDENKHRLFEDNFARYEKHRQEINLQQSPLSGVQSSIEFTVTDYANTKDQLLNAFVKVPDGEENLKFTSNDLVFIDEDDEDLFLKEQAKAEKDQALALDKSINKVIDSNSKVDDNTFANVKDIAHDSNQEPLSDLSRDTLDYANEQTKSLKEDSSLKSHNKPRYNSYQDLVKDESTLAYAEHRYWKHTHNIKINARASIKGAFDDKVAEVVYKNNHQDENQAFLGSVEDLVNSFVKMHVDHLHHNPFAQKVDVAKDEANRLKKKVSSHDLGFDIEQSGTDLANLSTKEQQDIEYVHKAKERFEQHTNAVSENVSSYLQDNLNGEEAEELVESNAPNSKVILKSKALLTPIKPNFVTIEQLIDHKKLRLNIELEHQPYNAITFIYSILNVMQARNNPKKSNQKCLLSLPPDQPVQPIAPKHNFEFKTHDESVIFLGKCYFCNHVHLCPYKLIVQQRLQADNWVHISLTKSLSQSDHSLLHEKEDNLENIEGYALDSTTKVEQLEHEGTSFDKDCCTDSLLEQNESNDFVDQTINKGATSSESMEDLGWGDQGIVSEIEKGDSLDIVDGEEELTLEESELRDNSSQAKDDNSFILTNGKQKVDKGEFSFAHTISPWRNQNHSGSNYQKDSAVDWYQYGSHHFSAQDSQVLKFKEAQANYALKNLKTSIILNNRTDLTIEKPFSPFAEKVRETSFSQLNFYNKDEVNVGALQSYMEVKSFSLAYEQFNTSVLEAALAVHLGLLGDNLKDQIIKELASRQNIKDDSNLNEEILQNLIKNKKPISLERVASLAKITQEEQNVGYNCAKTEPLPQAISNCARALSDFKKNFSSLLIPYGQEGLQDQQALIKAERLANKAQQANKEAEHISEPKLQTVAENPISPLQPVLFNADVIVPDNLTPDLGSASSEEHAEPLADYVNNQVNQQVSSDSNSNITNNFEKILNILSTSYIPLQARYVQDCCTVEHYRDTYEFNGRLDASFGVNLSNNLQVFKVSQPMYKNSNLVESQSINNVQEAMRQEVKSAPFGEDVNITKLQEENLKNVMSEQLLSQATDEVLLINQKKKKFSKD